MSYNIAITSIPAQGHINPTLAVVAELVGRGHRVVYAVTEQHERRVRLAGAAPILYATTIGTAPQGNELTPPQMKSRCLSRIAEWVARTQAYENPKPATDFTNLTDT